MTHRLHFTILLVALSTALLFGCNTKSHIGGDDAGTDGSTDGSVDTGPGGEACGPVTCGAGQVCCNASCGICTAPGLACPAIACADSGPPEMYCGGRGSEECPGDMFCDLGPSCGAADEGGVCRPRPDGCFEDCPGVCGCDGVSYCNECLANAAGVTVSEVALCEMPPPPPTGVACGGWAGDTCADDEFCDFGDSTGCDFADGGGVCELRPTACDLLYAPVCGCDGVTYSNECAAHVAGVDSQGPGDCATAGGSDPGSP